jgi:hypothetical protein
MNFYRFCALAAVLAASACGGTTGEVPSASSRQTSTMAELATGASVTRAYVGVDNPLAVDGGPVLATIGLRGGGQVELEVVTPDGAPLRFEVWQGHVDGTATLRMPVDSASGFALEEIDPDEDGTWAILFPGGQPGQVLVHMDCIGGLRGCSLLRQPGQSCPVGWSCDEGLVCQLPAGVCASPGESSGEGDELQARAGQ